VWALDGGNANGANNRVSGMGPSFSRNSSLGGSTHFINQYCCYYYYIGALFRITNPMQPPRD
jgi:hypothetical protein